MHLRNRSSSTSHLHATFMQHKTEHKNSAYRPKHFVQMWEAPGLKDFRPANLVSVQTYNVLKNKDVVRIQRIRFVEFGKRTRIVLHQKLHDTLRPSQKPRQNANLVSLRFFQCRKLPTRFHVRTIKYNGSSTLSTTLRKPPPKNLKRLVLERRSP